MRERKVVEVATGLETGAMTILGTPRAQSWDDAWLAFVDETEQRLQRRICGAHAPDGEPCKLASMHPNGRCRFHGGHPRIGGQPGNTNALVHGLYSRRLRQCNDTCPVWRMCPFAGADVLALSERKRPVCAYEREAYAIAMRVPEAAWFGTGENGTDATDGARGTGSPSGEGDGLPGFLSEPGKTPRESMTTQLRYRATPFFGSNRGTTTKFPRDAAHSKPAVPSDPLASSAASDPSVASVTSVPGPPPPDPAPAMIDDTGAILYAMLQRATLTVSAQQLTDQTEAASELYSFRTTKISAALTAFLRIGRELRAWLKLRPVPAVAASGNGPGFDDDKERPEFNEQGYQQFYDYKGNRIGLPILMHPFLHELDAAVEQLRQEGIKIAPPQAT